MHYENLTYLMIEPNSTCNLHCITCNRDRLVELGYRQKKLLTEQEFDFYLSQFQGCPIDTIKFEGLSEPMMHPKFDRLLERLRKAFPKAFVIIATNLQYKVDKTPLIPSIQLSDMVYLSIDGGPTNYERQRVGAKWDKLINSLDQLKQLTSTETRKTKLHINFTLTPENHMDLPQMYQLKDQYDLSSVRINLAQNWNEDQDNKHQFTDELLETLKPYKADIKGIPNWNYKDCFWPKNGVVVDVYGNVRQCIINTSQKPLGNLNQTPVKQILNQSKHLSEVRHCLDRNTAHASCLTCDYKFLSSKLQKIFGDEAANIKPRAIRTSTDANG